jgi:CHAT domain-containing protein/tetratricopeptide (TPR) repeat protein
MARICSPDRRWFVLALALLITGAAVRSPEREARSRAEALCDSEAWPAAELFLRRTLIRFADSDSDDVWALRLLHVTALTGMGEYGDASTILAIPLPQRLAHNAIGVRWIFAQGILAFRQRKNDAVPLLMRAEALAKRYQPQLVAEALADLANVEAAGRKDIAVQHAREAIRLARSYPQQPKVMVNALGALARIRTLQRRYDEAIDANQRALKIATAAAWQSKVQKLSANLGWAYILLGDFDTATEYLTAALPIAERIDAPFDAAIALHNLGDIATYKRDYAAALDYYQRGIVQARRAKHRDLGEFTANIAAALLNKGDPVAARKANEEARALIDQNDDELILRLAMIDARIDAASGDIDNAVRKIKEVIAAAKPSQRWEAEAHLAEFLVAAKNPSQAAEQFSRAINVAAALRGTIENEELRLSYGALVRQFTEEYVDLLLSQDRVAEALDVVETSRAQTLDAALDTTAVRRKPNPMHVAAARHVVILSYWITPEHSYVWTITPSRIDVTPIGPGTAIEREVDAYSRELGSLRASETSKKHGAELYAKLVQPVARRIARGAHLVVVPDGRLQAFNLETLIEPSTHYWIEHVTLETTASLTLLNRARAESPNSMLLIGNPPSAAPEFPPLTKAPEEVLLVQRRFASACTTLTGTGATPRNYRTANAGSFGYIHFVAHGTASRLRPLESAVVLANDGDSYKLYARDIVKQKLHARLVTISSCHGAGTRAYTGEGLVGLAWAFLHAGAHQVIAALWEVNDNATPKLMDDLYAGIHAGQDPATALRNAKLKLIRGGSVFRQPRYWAPFVLYSGS